MTYDGTERNLEAEATDYSTQTDRGSTVSVRISLDGKDYRALLYLKGEYALKPGDRLKGAFRIRMTHEGLEESTYHRGSGVFILGYGLDECQIFPCEKSSLRYFPARLRQEIVTRLETVFPEDVAFFTKALLLGDRSDVDYQTNTAFKTSGISHIIAVSGLHVSILFSVVFLLMGKKRILTAMLGIPLLILFAALAGFTPSITRACIMQILMILATLINREYDPPTALSTAVLLMLLINPMVVTSASFQLSV
jgi:competence protein ComEC